MAIIEAPTREKALRIYKERLNNIAEDLELTEFSTYFRETRLAGYMAFEKLVNLYDEIPDIEVKARAGTLALIIKSRNDLLNCDSNLQKNKIVADLINKEADKLDSAVSRWDKYQEIANT